MALQVWLPLTRDLRQQGLSDATVTNSGATYSSTGGKLGGCYSFDGTNDRIQISNLPNPKDISVAFWMKRNADTGTRQFMFTAWEGVTCELQASNSFHCGVYNNGSTVGACSNTSEKITVSSGWVHVVYTFKDKIGGKLYLNGSLISTASYSGSIQWSTTTGNIGYYNTYFNGAINDFRLYDHCLSQMEIKELAKGLILHYPLNRQGWGQENLVNNSDFSNLATTGTVIRDETVLFHSHPTCKISRTGATSNTYTGWTSQDLFSRLTPGIKVTASVWVYRESTHGIDSGCEWRMYQRYNNGASTDWTGFYSAANWPIGEWKKFTYTYTVRSDISGAYLNFNVVKNGTYWLAEPKVEIGEKATSWSPSTTDELAVTMGLNGTTEYDCSGYCNNGTKTGTFDWTSDTPKYGVSTKFSGSNYILTDSGTFSWFDFSECTIAVWMKPTTIPSSWAGTFGIAHNNSSNNKSFAIGNYGGVFTVQSANGSWVNIQSSSLPINEWHHCVATLDGTTIKMYFDGELVKTYTTSWGTTTVASDTRVQVGNDLPGSDEIYQGYYSDARIYATALSADDVKSLYQNCATIDSDGTIRGQIRS